MNGVDYTKKFAEVTSDYRDTLDRKNKAHKSELDRLKANHDHVQKTQKKSR